MADEDFSFAPQQAGADQRAAQKAAPVAAAAAAASLPVTEAPTSNPNSPRGDPEDEGVLLADLSAGKRSPVEVSKLANGAKVLQIFNTEGPKGNLDRNFLQYTWHVFKENKRTYEFSTVEGFWRVQNKLPKPAFNPKLEYMFCRSHDLTLTDPPMATYEHFRQGGFFSFNCKFGNIDDTWEQMLLHVIGSSTPSMEHVVAILLKLRSGKIEVWTDTTEAAHCKRIGDDILAIGMHPHKTEIKFKAFKVYLDQAECESKKIPYQGPKAENLFTWNC